MIEGLEEFIHDLQKIERDAKAAQQRAAIQTAAAIVEAAKAIAPRDSGALADAIDYEVVSDGVEVGIRADLTREFKGELRHPDDYAEKVEFGDGDQAAEPFLRPAIDAADGRFFEEEVGKVVSDGG